MLSEETDGDATVLPHKKTSGWFMVLYIELYKRSSEVWSFSELPVSAVTLPIPRTVQ